MPKPFASHLLCFVSCCLLLAACDSATIFEKSIDIPNATWRYEDGQTFKFEVADTTQSYQLLLGVEHAGDFGFQNCYVQITTRFPNGEEKKQPVSLELAGQSGIWIGKCNGNDCSLEIPLQARARFRQPGEYSITVEQFMRVNPLPGIKAISLKVKQLE